MTRTAKLWKPDQAIPLTVGYSDPQQMAETLGRFPVGSVLHVIEQKSSKKDKVLERLVKTEEGIARQDPSGTVTLL